MVLMLVNDILLVFLVPCIHNCECILLNYILYKKRFVFYENVVNMKHVKYTFTLTFTKMHFKSCHLYKK